ncbi:nicotinamide riboside transporter PnuC [Psychrosphaera haliotis]|uniref:Nicotinamide riboside transporter PnuC n=1 Tax=Psychrosphaera haliotis TaxID=555083 RepID=A0A6N8FD01_9GAMM|nr:nicotinamide riboside transporter PnuC [Psychrosphaera haliotis]MDB2374178.1 nicotinamide riboside transporter PnuC [Psychrosphaera haliotis]MUH73449.1 nicotinamide riboside transporter PnuC [Psychrosphaera haliotis]
MMEQLLTGFNAMSVWEYIGVATGLMYLLLAIKQSSWCWPAAFVSTLIYMNLFWQGALLLESALNFYYLLMAIYGWWQWNGGLEESNTKPVVSWSLNKHTKIVVVLTIISLVVGFLADEYTTQKMAYLDSFTTCFAVYTTYMVTQKVLENWLYWLFIDVASIYLYYQTGYLPTAALFVLYTFLALKGYVEWRDELQDKPIGDKKQATTLG